MLNAARIEGMLPAGYRLKCADTVSSTNGEVRYALDQGRPEGFVVAALRQVGGYGRQGRVWKSPYGGVYFSFILKPGVSPASLPTIALVMSLSVRMALERMASHEKRGGLTIKWPNDIMCAQGKLCGISTEVVGDAVIVGIGINVFPPIKPMDVGGKNIPAYYAPFCSAVHERAIGIEVSDEGLSDAQVGVLEDILAVVISRFDKVYRLWLEAGFKALVDDYNAHAALIGEEVTVSTQTGGVLALGVVERIDAEGRLCIRGADGALSRISSGEVHLL